MVIFTITINQYKNIQNCFVSIKVTAVLYDCQHANYNFKTTLLKVAENILKRAINPRAPHQLSEEKVQLLLDCARLVFQENGVGNATIDDIAARAGISKATVYRRFANKTELFEKVVLDTSDRIASKMSRIELDSDNPESSLISAAKLIRNLVQENVEFQRLLISEAQRHSELCQAARKRMNATAEKKLGDFFTLLRRQGRMTHTNMESAVWTFFIIAAGGMRTLFNIEPTSAQEEKRWLADIKLYIRGCGIG